MVRVGFRIMVLQFCIVVNLCKRWLGRTANDVSRVVFSVSASRTANDV